MTSAGPLPDAVDSGSAAAPVALAGPAAAGPGVLRRLVTTPTVAPAVVLLTVVVAAGLLAPRIAPYDPLDQDLVNAFGHPSAGHWLGTDNLGRDLLSRLLQGARVALIAMGEGVGIAVLVGVPLGLAIGYAGGWWDRIAMRVVEAVVSMPGIMLAIVVVTILGIGLTNALVALGLLYSTQFIRLTRGLVIAEREEDYVRAARVLGAGPARITVRHLVPNIAGPIIVQITLTCGSVLLAEAGLSFLGLAVQPPDASWGTMLTTASQFLALDPWQAIPPGAAIFATVLAVNLIGDALRDAISPGRHPAAASSPLPGRIRLRPGWAPPAGSGAPDGAVDPGGSRPRTAPDDARGPVGGGSPAAGGRSVATDPEGRGALLVVSGLEVRFPGADGTWRPVVTDVSFSVERGRSLALVGESGSGKTVSALAALGMVPPPGAIAAGSITLDGHDLLTLPPRRLTALRGDAAAMVFQDPMASLNPSIRVGRQLVEVLRHKRGLSGGEARRRAVELLDLVGIPDAAARARSFPHELSGGMVQRVAIARALSCDPDLLIADEPTTALDVTVQAGILDLLARLRDELGMAILFISHDLSVVAGLCDRAAVLYAGQIVEEAPIDELLTRPRHPYTEALLRSVPHASGRGGPLPTIPGSVPRAGHWEPGCRFAPRCGHETAGCDGPQALVTASAVGGRRTVRCHRAPELTLRGVETIDDIEVSDAAGG